jgi:hypothetical protein
MKAAVNKEIAALNEKLKTAANDAEKGKIHARVATIQAEKGNTAANFKNYTCHIRPVRAF